MRPELEINGHHDTLLPSVAGLCNANHGNHQENLKLRRKAIANSCAGGIWLIPNVFKLWLSNGN